MREIKFRGQGVYDGDWHYGFYREFTMPSCWKHEAYKDGVNYYIDEKGSNESYLVIPSTIGQFTGLRDKNGREIYEGDLCAELDKDGKETGSILQILWSGYYKFDAKVIKGGTLSEGLSFPLWHWDNRKENGFRQLEIIGSIYTAPELLEEDK